jgi:hypothetical protein
VTFTPEEKFQWETRAVERYWSGVTPEVSAAEESGTKWAKHFLPSWFSRPFTEYQNEFWDWGWGIEPDEIYRPRVECEPRGVGKSTNAEAWVVSLVARKKRKMIGYVSLTEDKASKHFEGIKSMLESDAIQTAYPHCKPRIQKLRDATQQWSREAIVLDSGAMIVPLTMLGSSRGWKSSEGSRFDVIVLDDIDALGQTPEYTKKLIEMLKGEILAAGNDKTVVLVPQNLIYRDSIVSQIHDQRADILSNRIFCGPYPLLKWYDAEKVDIPGDNTGAKEWVITRGEAFDPAIDISYAESLLNTYGKAMFDRECQQLVHQIEDDKDFREWDEVYHLVTYSEFRRTMEELGEWVWNEKRLRLQIPQRWNVGLGMDWGTTKGHPTGVAFVARPAESCPLHDSYFSFAEVIKPDYPIDAHETPEIVSPGRVAKAINAELKEWNVAESQIKMQLMSHEASAAMNTLIIDLPDEDKRFFNKWKAHKGSGVPQIQNVLEIDYTKKHPFRRYPSGHKIDGEDVGGQPLIGSPRMFFLVEDGQGMLRADATGKLYVNGAKNAKGFARARFEIPIYNHKISGQKKIDDDYTDGLKGLMNRFGPRIGPLTQDERIERTLESKGLAMTEIEQIEDERDKIARMQVRLVEQAALKKPQNKYPRVAVKWR